MTELETTKRTNPLDALMTKTQVVRRKFKSGLPRTIENRKLSKMEALARTMELFDKLRSEMDAAGLDMNDVSAGLVYTQPGNERVLANVARLPKPGPGSVGKFCDELMDLGEPVLFLGVLFAQHDSDPECKAKHKNVVFVWPFMLGPEAEGRLLAARN